MKRKKDNSISFSKPNLSSVFTLIELLMVTAIIMMLCCLLLPALRKASDTAKAVDCMSRLKQMTLVVTTYASDNRGIVFNCSEYAPEYDWDLNPAGGFTNTGWINWYEALGGKYSSRGGPGEYVPRERSYIAFCPGWKEGCEAGWQSNIPSRYQFGQRNGWTTKYHPTLGEYRPEYRGWYKVFKDQIIVVPDSTDAKEIDWHISQGTPSYIKNPGVGKKAVRVPPSHFVIHGDTVRWNPVYSKNTQFYILHGNDGQNDIYKLNLRHPGTQANASFMDGHVEPLGAFKSEDFGFDNYHFDTARYEVY